MEGWARQKRLLLAVKPADRQIRKRKVHLRYKYNLICIFHSHGYKLMSQDSREKFGVKSQMRGGGGGGRAGGGGGGGGGGRRREKRERIC